MPSLLLYRIAFAVIHTHKLLNALKMHSKCFCYYPLFYSSYFLFWCSNAFLSQSCSYPRISESVQPIITILYRWRIRYIKLLAIFLLESNIV